MRILEILSEAIEPKRDKYHKVLVDNKKELQKSRTRLGVIRNLQRMFPDIIFKMVGGRGGRAYYNQKEKTVTINNQDKLMTGRNVRRNWDTFLKDMTELLTHETIHRDQAERRDFLIPGESKGKASKKESEAYKQKWMDLNSLYNDYRQMGNREKANEVQKQIDKLVNTAAKRGVRLRKTRQAYLSDRDEITAYAETIANDLLQKYSNSGISKEQMKQKAIDDLKSRPGEMGQFDLNSYIEELGMNNKSTHQLFKQIVRYIEAR